MTFPSRLSDIHSGKVDNSTILLLYYPTFILYKKQKCIRRNGEMETRRNGHLETSTSIVLYFCSSIETGKTVHRIANSFAFYQKRNTKVHLAICQIVITGATWIVLLGKHARWIFVRLCLNKITDVVWRTSILLVFLSPEFHASQQSSENNDFSFSVVRHT